MTKSNPPSLKGKWEQINDPNIIHVNSVNAQTQGVSWDTDSGLYAFNNSVRTKETGISKSFELMDEVCAFANSILGREAIIASYQGQNGVTLVTDGKTLDELKTIPDKQPFILAQ